MISLNKLTLSPIIFGSMRFDPERLSKKEGQLLLEKLYEGGINTIHSSHEYPFHEFFCDTLTQFNQNRSERFFHVAKIASPHFKERKFDANTFEQRIDSQLKELGADCIDIVQWLLRLEGHDEDKRLSMLEDTKHELSYSVDSLIKKGKIKTLVTFPYGNSFANHAIELDCCSGTTDYLNALERTSITQVEKNAALNKHFIAIRPLAAGNVIKLIDEQPDTMAQIFNVENDKNNLIKKAITYPLLHPQVTSTILTVSSVDHAGLAIEVNQSAYQNKALFDSISKQMDKI